jgi:hypothetical protein
MNTRAKHNQSLHNVTQAALDLARVQRAFGADYVSTSAACLHDLNKQPLRETATEKQTAPLPDRKKRRVDHLLSGRLSFDTNFNA